jgi:trehalose 6-phosphate synthase
MSDLVVVSNRGPAAITIAPDGSLVVGHAAGGLAPSLSRALAGSGAVWVAAALSEGERRAAASGLSPELLGGLDLALVPISEEVAAAAYTTIANDTLWFVHHNMFDRVRRPVFGRSWFAAFDGYRAYNAAIAEEVAARAASDATVVVHDYHLALVGSFLRAARPDLATVHFTHTPFCTAEELAVLPDAVANELLEGYASFGACGFHAVRWADAFRQCCSTYRVGPPEVFVSPLGSDAIELDEIASSPEVAHYRESLAARVDGRRLLFRSDRVELSKNLVRGFLAFEELLENEPTWRGRAIFLARAYPSRTELAEYRSYRAEIETVVARINERFASGDYLPIELDIEDDFAASIAALSLYDVLVVNPIRDGMNLVAKEGPIVNRRDGVLVLSRDAGAYAELGDVALGVQPYDVSGTAAVYARALAMEPDERARRAGLLKEIAGARPPAIWHEDVIAHACRPQPPRRELS